MSVSELPSYNDVVKQTNITNTIESQQEKSKDELLIEALNRIKILEDKLNKKQETESLQALNKIKELENLANKSESKKEKIKKRIEELKSQLKSRQQSFSENYRIHSSLAYNYRHSILDQSSKEIDLLRKSINDLQMEYYKCID